MCCLFTCVGWVIDLIQRVWTFTMSCCISSAVCCTLVTASMAGVALGYNYSLAEYVENRETNVSVYLKRGVFDDHVIDEMEWRRKGGGEAEEVSQTEVYAGRRSESMFDVERPKPAPESPYETNEQHRFEGSLLKLTANPSQSVNQDNYVTQNTNDNQLQVIGDLLNRRKLQYTSTEAQTFRIDSYTPNQVKVVQDLINRRKMAYKNLIATRKNTQSSAMPPQHTPDLSNRRMMRPDAGAVHPSLQDDDDTDVPKWYQTKLQPTQPHPLHVETPRIPLLPDGAVRVVVKRPRTSTPSTSRITPPGPNFPNFRKSYDNNADFSGEGHSKNEYTDKNIIPHEGKDYDEKDIQGYPVRRKRKADYPAEEKFIENLNKNMYHGNSLFAKLMGVLKNAGLYTKRKVSTNNIGELTKFTLSGISNADTVDTVNEYSMPNVNLFTTEAHILRIIKSSTKAF